MRVTSMQPVARCYGISTRGHIESLVSRVKPEIDTGGNLSYEQWTKAPVLVHAIHQCAPWGIVRMLSVLFRAQHVEHEKSTERYCTKSVYAAL